MKTEKQIRYRVELGNMYVSRKTDIVDTEITFVDNFEKAKLFKEVELEQIIKQIPQCTVVKITVNTTEEIL